jgi:hypothetical protein
MSPDNTIVSATIEKRGPRGPSLQAVYICAATISFGLSLVFAVTAIMLWLIAPLEGMTFDGSETVMLAAALLLGYSGAHFMDITEAAIRRDRN